jgi:hypothetical protein
MKAKAMRVKEPIRGRFTAWSFSRWDQHALCPYQAGLRHLNKRPEGPKSPALIRGDEIHRAAAAYAQGLTTKLHPELAKVRKTLDEAKRRLAKGSAEVERRVALSKSWAVLPDFFHPATWFRSIVDLKELISPTVLRITDWKTGKLPENLEKAFYQLELYALVGFVESPRATTVESRLVFTDHNHPEVKLYRREDLERLKRTWVKRVKPMFADTRFEPTPGAHCRWCPYSAAKGGPCPYPY